MNQYQILLLVIILLISGITDILYARIYNYITFPGIVMGLALSYHYNGTQGLIASGVGLLLCTGIFMFLYIWGGIGAGDAKLMMAIGAIAGYRLIFGFILYSAIAGGIMANVAIIKNKVFKKTWQHVGRFFLFLVPKYHLKSEPLKKTDSFFIPYGYAISIGSMVYLYFFI